MVQVRVIYLVAVDCCHSCMCILRTCWTYSAGRVASFPGCLKNMAWCTVHSCAQYSVNCRKIIWLMLLDVYGFPCLYENSAHVPTVYTRPYFSNGQGTRLRQRRYGTLIYHKSCKLIHALSSALGKGEIRAEINNRHKPNNQHSTPTLVQQMQAVDLHMNTKLHEQAN